MGGGALFLSFIGLKRGVLFFWFHPLISPPNTVFRNGGIVVGTGHSRQEWIRVVVQASALFFEVCSWGKSNACLGWIIMTTAAETCFSQTHENSWENKRNNRWSGQGFFFLPFDFFFTFSTFFLSPKKEQDTKPARICASWATAGGGKEQK